MDTCAVSSSRFPTIPCVRERTHHGNHRGVGGHEWPQSPSEVIAASKARDLAGQKQALEDQWREFERLIQPPKRRLVIVMELMDVQGRIETSESITVNVPADTTSDLVRRVMDAAKWAAEL